MNVQRVKKVGMFTQFVKNRGLKTFLFSKFNSFVKAANNNKGDRMKLITALLVFIFSLTVNALDEATVCEELYDEAISNCHRYMCEQYLEDQELEVNEKNISDCLDMSDGDAAEGAQICATEGELDDLIKEYNKKNPKKQVTCEDE